MNDSQESGDHAETDRAFDKNSRPADLQSPPEIDFEEISVGGDKVYIRLGTTRYELKRTRSGRLVLHK